MMNIEYVQCHDSESFYVSIDDGYYEVAYLIDRDNDLVYLGIRDTSHYYSYKSMYVLEYPEAVNIFMKNIRNWKTMLHSLSMDKTINYETTIDDTRHLFETHVQDVKGYGLGTSLSYLVKQINNAIEGLLV